MKKKKLSFLVGYALCATVIVTSPAIAFAASPTEQQEEIQNEEVYSTEALNETEEVLDGQEELNASSQEETSEPSENTTEAPNSDISEPQVENIDDVAEENNEVSDTEAPEEIAPVAEESSEADLLSRAASETPVTVDRLVNEAGLDPALADVIYTEMSQWDPMVATDLDAWLSNVNSSFYADGKGIQKLTGIDKIRGVISGFGSEFYLSNNQITDLSPLANSNGLLFLENNPVKVIPKGLNNRSDIYLQTNNTKIPIARASSVSQTVSGMPGESVTVSLNQSDLLFYDDGTQVPFYPMDLSSISTSFDGWEPYYYDRDQTGTDIAVTIPSDLKSGQSKTITYYLAFHAYDNVKNGDEYYYAKMKDLYFTYPMQLTFKAASNPITGISLINLEKRVELATGSKTTYEYQLDIQNPDLPTTDSTDVTWKSGNTAVATIDKDGFIQTKKAGTTRITVTTSNGKSAYNDLKVTDPKVSLDKTKVTMTVGEKLTLNTSCVPSSSLMSKPAWSLSKRGVLESALFDSFSNTFTAKAPGTVTISTQGNWGDVTKYTKCVVTVVEKKPEPTPDPEPEPAPDPEPTPKPEPTPDPKPDYSLSTDGICWNTYEDRIELGLSYRSSDPNVQFKWQSYNLETKKWKDISGWSKSNCAKWTPKRGVYWIHAVAKTSNGKTSEQTVGYTAYRSYPLYITGKYQGPNYGGSGWLMGVSSNINPGQKCRYEMLILDCDKLARDDPYPWIYSTGQTPVSGGSTLWTTYLPPHPGYYWTYFRIFDEKGNLLEDQCYGSVFI